MKWIFDLLGALDAVWTFLAGTVVAIFGIYHATERIVQHKTGEGIVIGAALVALGVWLCYRAIRDIEEAQQTEREEAGKK